MFRGAQGCHEGKISLLDYGWDTDIFTGIRRTQDSGAPGKEASWVTTSGRLGRTGMRIDGAGAMPAGRGN